MFDINGGQLVAIVALMIPIAAIVMNGIVKMRTRDAEAGLSGEAERALTDRADRLTERVAQLETILDAESPGWRSRAS